MAMNPVNYADDPDLFDTRREQLNRVLSFSGLLLREDGEMIQIPPASSLRDLEGRVTRLRRELDRRNVHADVLQFCKAELLQENYFHAVFEATKSVADKIRSKSGYATDGHKLVDDAFGGNPPTLAFNTLQTPTDRSEHIGIMSLLKGLFSTFRNVTAHEPKIKWNISENDALDIMTLASMLHRRLDSAVPTNPGTISP